MGDIENKGLPKVLVCFVMPWNDNGSQHSLAEIFSRWDKDKLALVYARAELPNTQYCDRFFRINENAMVKSVFNRKVKTSSVVHNSDKAVIDSEAQELEKEKKRYRNTSKRRNWFMVYARELVWKFGKWKTAELKKFIDDFDPDIVFIPLDSKVYMTRIGRFVAQYTKKPVVCYVTDDTVTFKYAFAQPVDLFRKNISVRNNARLIKGSEKVFVMAPKAKAELDELYGVDCSILTKPVDFSGLSFEEKSVNKPLKMIYTGLLSIGREKSLCQIAKAVARINKNGEKIRFEIYSSDTPKRRNRKVLSSGGVHFCGNVSREAVNKLQKEADITVFAESLSYYYKSKARLSFSTKLTDYFASSSCIFALGLEDIAPMEYLKSNDAALTVNRYEDIEEKLRLLCDNPELVREYGRKAFDCGRKNHNKDKILSDFEEEMLKVYSKCKGKN